MVTSGTQDEMNGDDLSTLKGHDPLCPLQANGQKYTHFHRVRTIEDGAALNPVISPHLSPKMAKLIDMTRKRTVQFSDYRGDTQEARHAAKDEAF